MPPYYPRTSLFRRIVITVRQPWIWFPLLLGCSVVLHLQIVRIVHQRPDPGCRQEPVRSALDNYQDLHNLPIVNEEFFRSVPIVRSENAIVTSMYNDAFAVPIVTLGHSLNKVDSKARRIVFYLPGSVSERALCIATASGFEPHAVSRIDPPADGGVHQHFIDQFTKLSIWKFDELGVKAVVYLDADTLVRRNFDELFALPFNFAAVPDVYIGDPGFSIGFNAGVLFVRPSTKAFRELVSQINTARYPHWEAEQAFLNVFFGAEAVRLPYIYNGNMAIKRRNPELWEGLQSEMRLIHYSLVKPFWRGVYNETGLEDMHENVLRRAEDWDGTWRDEILEWGETWKEAEDTYRYAFTRCGWKHGH
ncbi:nucleotide-diphospho-sugar transferase [Lentinus tigrinus ALCF2SS1-7]|uniref:Nucleotide-diphospho-sugar transferase n=1 Tax=Lentinus tigrinus ALCF2SS1-6 TaxID=1328759 RepID=A0A5C2SST1_9APHY|nr:nucleotide-diphospho-sugar transferase [Lentinus tigrinus ALCF2SS1-6]RPD80856.1 nucleotide-diphospho-sugar transferase [Lentinus tigrinus ALCF2SS1-7]